MDFVGIIQSGGPLVGVIFGLLWLMWQERKSHMSALESMIPKPVYDDLCKQRDQQTGLLASLTSSVAILVDRRESPR